MNFKKLFAILAIAALTIGATSCKKEEKPADQPATTEQPAKNEQAQPAPQQQQAPAQEQPQQQAPAQ